MTSNKTKMKTICKQQNDNISKKGGGWVLTKLSDRPILFMSLSVLGFPFRCTANKLCNKQ